MSQQKLISAALAVVVLGAAPAPVRAQEAKIARPVRIDIGLLLPTDGTVRSRTGSTHFAIGGTLDVQKYGQGVLGLYADGSLLNESRKAMNMASGGVSYRSYPSSGAGAYVGLGAGVYYLDYKDNAVDGNKTGLGGKVFAGYDFPAGPSWKPTTPSRRRSWAAARTAFNCWPGIGSDPPGQQNRVVETTR